MGGSEADGLGGLGGAGLGSKVVNFHQGAIVITVKNGDVSQISKQIKTQISRVVS